MRSLAIVLAVVGARAAAAAPARLAPPLPASSPLTELANAIRQHDVVTLAAPADAALVQAAFLAGSWDAFDTWAELVLAHKLPGTAASPPDTPHGHYWAAVLARPAPE